MQCAPKYEFGLFGSLFFFGVVLSSMIFPALSDKIGRRSVLIVGESIQLIASLLLLMVGSKNVAYSCVFMLGLDFGSRVFVGYIFIMEFLPE